MGKVLFTATARKNPIDNSVAYYPIIVSSTRILTNDLVDYISENSQLPRSIVPAALAAIQKSIFNFVLNGHSVTIPRIGTFTCTMKGYPSATPAEVKAEKIKKIYCRFRPSAKMADPVKYGLQYERVKSKYE